MNSTDTITHKAIGFDNQKYMALQKAALSERLAHFPSGTLYLEIGGKFLFDPHAQRVLPGFEPDVKVRLIKELGVPFSVIYCVNAKDLQANRMLTNKNLPYKELTLQSIDEYTQALGVKPFIAINLVSQENLQTVENYQKEVSQRGYQSFKRFVIDGYPAADKILTAEGYGKDEAIDVSERLVLVIGPASNSGKMSTCLGQIYHDIQKGKDSGYAKYELFPIWNLPLEHPVNLAYEAATVDIGDYNAIDPFYKHAYRKDAVNYNRDIDAFPIVFNIAQKLGSPNNFMHTYKSPTDMGMNMAGFAIINDMVVARSAYEEIIRRKEWAITEINEGRGLPEWIKAYEVLENRALKYFSL